MSQTSAQATALQQEQLRSAQAQAQALEKMKQERIQQQATLAAERQADEEVRAAANSALLAQQQQTREMHEAAALRLHAVTEEHAFAKVAFDQADQADAALEALNVVQQKSELAVMKRRCEQAKDLLQQDQRAIDGKLAAHADDVAQMRASFQSRKQDLFCNKLPFRNRKLPLQIKT